MLLGVLVGSLAGSRQVTSLQPFSCLLRLHLLAQGIGHIICQAAGSPHAIRSADSRQVGQPAFSATMDICAAGQPVCRQVACCLSGGRCAETATGQGAKLQAGRWQAASQQPHNTEDSDIATAKGIKTPSQRHMEHLHTQHLIDQQTEHTCGLPGCPLLVSCSQPC